MTSKTDSFQYSDKNSDEPGFIGSLVYLHGTLYAKEYRLDHTFEGYVAAAAGEFAKTYDPDKDYFGVAESGGRILGIIAIVAVLQTVAQLRWFLVHPDARGAGLGRRLIAEALQFCRDRKYKTVFLWTISELEVAAHLYRSFGFQRSETKTHKIWGAIRTEERYDLDLGSQSEISK